QQSTPFFMSIDFTTFSHNLSGHGLGLRSDHIPEILQTRPAVDWFEVITENYMHNRGEYFETLLKLREDYPIVTHGVSLSIGSTDPLDVDYLRLMKEYIDILQPEMISDHMCWNHVSHQYSHDLLPLPMNQEVVTHIANRVDQVQNYLKRPILLENVSSYVGYKDTNMFEWEFLTEIAKKSGCGILLDLNNIYVNSFNFGFDGKDFVQGIPTDKIGYLHFGGHDDKTDYLFDTHGKPMKNEAWELYRYFLTIHGPRPTTFEWDMDIPPFHVLLEQRAIAMEIEKNAVA
ncbi:MAG: DUF692 domain-containing protein, partial [Bdellovibrionales bacterium]|nr:DUF692 domain-containing protein [Bdellovibrionales bacterium]